MTSKALPNNFHPARQLFAYSLKRTAGLTVLMTVVALLACPVYTLLKISGYTRIPQGFITLIP